MMIKIPRRLDDLVPTAAIEKVLDVLNQPELYQGVKDAVGKSVKEVNPVEKMQSAWQQTRLWLEELTIGRESSQPREIINASGQIFTDQFAGLPTLPIVAYGHAKAASTFRDRASELKRSDQVIQQLTTAKHNALLGDVFASLIVATSAMQIKRLVVANSDLVRLPAVGNIASMLDMLPIEVTRVGATNGTSSTDWEAALTNASSAALFVSPNGMESKSTEGQRENAVAVAKRASAPVLEILADGVFNVDVAQRTGLIDVTSRIGSGSTVIVPLLTLLGGPTGCLLAGNEAKLNMAKALADNLGVGLSQAEVSAASTALQMHNSNSELDAGTQQLFDANLNNLKDRARRIALQLHNSGPIETAQEVERSVALGSAPWNQHTFPTWSVELTARDAAELTDRMHDNDGECSVAYEREGDKFLLHLRFVPASRDHQLVNILTAQSDMPPCEEADEQT